AIAADGALDLLGRVAGAGNAALAGGEHRHAPPLPDGEGGAGVLAEVQLLQRDGCRLVRVEQGSDLGMQLGQSALARGGGAGLDHAAVEREQALSTPRDDAVARARKAWVDAKDDHGS